MRAVNAVDPSPEERAQATVRIVEEENLRIHHASEMPMRT